MRYNDNEIKEILKSALNLWWLRPENALALASYTIYGVDLLPKDGQKYADLACGDGVNTFFKCGGRYDPQFDLFISGISTSSTKEVVQKGVDVFDTYDENYQPRIINKPTSKYFVGTDHKENLIKKANHLDFYENTFVSDLRDEVCIEDESLDLIYCNALYYVIESDTAVENMKRKLKKDGTIVLDLFNTNKYLLDWGKIYPSTTKEWQEMLNRGRQESNPGLKSTQGWEEMFSTLGLSIVEKKDIFPPSITHFWNLGLRPIFPILNKMASNITYETRKDIKEEWVEVFTELLYPILKDPYSFSNDKLEYNNQYILKVK